MKRDVIVSATVAVAVHISVLSAALPEAIHTHGNIYKPIALSIVPPSKAAVSPSPKAELVETGLKPHLLPKSEAGSKPTLIPKKKRGRDKHLAARRAIKKREAKVNRPREVTRLEPAFGPEDKVESVPEPSFSDVPEGPDKKIDGESPFKTASIPNHTNQDKGKDIETPQGYGSTEGIITYATPKYKENPRPHYPNMARRRGYEGRTLLRVEVLENGRVGRIEIATSSGFDVLDRGALASVRDWTFVPGTENGKNMRQWVMVPVKFSLR